MTGIYYKIKKDTIAFTTDDIMLEYVEKDQTIILVDRFSINIETDQVSAKSILIIDISKSDIDTLCKFGILEELF